MTTTEATQNTENTKTSADLVMASHRDGRKQMTLAGEQADADWKVRECAYARVAHAWNTQQRVWAFEMDKFPTVVENVVGVRCTCVCMCFFYSLLG